MKIILLGAPGAGKGTQGDLIVNQFKIKRISTGDLLREEVRNKTALGLQVQQILTDGKLVPDDIIMSLTIQEISKNIASGFILDGVPRTVGQASEIDKFLQKEFNSKIDVVISLDIAEEKIINRLSNRFYCKKCNEAYNKIYKNLRKEGVCDVCGSHEFFERSDDNAEVISHRFAIYREQTLPILSRYEKLGIVKVIDADQEVEKVSGEIVKEMKNLLT